MLNLQQTEHTLLELEYIIYAERSYMWSVTVTVNLEGSYMGPLAIEGIFECCDPQRNGMGQSTEMTLLGSL